MSRDPLRKQDWPKYLAYIIDGAEVALGESYREKEYKLPVLIIIARPIYLFAIGALTVWCVGKMFLGW